MSYRSWIAATLVASAAMGCPSTSTPPDSGMSPGTDSGTPVVDSGIPGTDSGTPGLDSGTPAVDAGPPPPSIYSCAGIESCWAGANFASEAVSGCESVGTDAGAQEFQAVAACEQSCASSSDAGACLAADIADGGACASQWGTCAANGVSCADIIECLETYETAPDSWIYACVYSGTERAIGLALPVIECDVTYCSQPDASVDCSSTVASPGGPCFSILEACVEDNGESSPDAGPDADAGPDGGATDGGL